VFAATVKTLDEVLGEKKFSFDRNTLEKQDIPKLPHLFALSLIEALVRENDRKRQSRVPINTGTAVTH